MAIMINGVPCCECGCGEPVGVWPWTDRWAGRIGGQPKRRIKDHNKGLLPRDPAARRVYEYRPMVERVIGRPLPAAAVIHHINEDRTDNRNENLVVCENDAYHKFLHVRLKAFKACGHADWVRCVFCKEWGPVGDVRVSKGSRYHRSCAAKNAQLKRLKRREKEGGR